MTGERLTNNVALAKELDSPVLPDGGRTGPMKLASFGSETDPVKLANPSPDSRGLQMIDLHDWPAPNGKKVTILLEELGLPYTVVPCDIGKGDQFKDGFLKIGPNGCGQLLMFC